MNRLRWGIVAGVLAGFAAGGLVWFGQSSDAEVTCPPSPGEVHVIEDWVAGANSIEELVRASPVIVVADYVEQRDLRIELPPVAERTDVERHYRPVETLKGNPGNAELISVWLTREFRDETSFALCVKAELPEPAKGGRYVLFLSQVSDDDGDGWRWSFASAPSQARVVDGRLEFEPIVTERELPDGRQLSLPPGTNTRFAVSLGRVRQLAAD